MSLRSSADTLTANLAQQASGILLFLLLPNILPAAQYALVVIAMVILGFSRFPDLGLSLVYGREAPRLYGIGDLTKLQRWNQTVVWFSTLSGSVVGVVAGLFLFANGASLELTILFSAVPAFSAAISAYVSFAAVSGEFARYRTVQVVLSLGRLLAIPLVIAFGLIGWFGAQLAAPWMALAKAGREWIPWPPRIEWSLVKQNLPAGVHLALISILWFQLLDSARLLATIHYATDAVAAYGIVAAGYQSAYTLIISAFLPVSVKTLTLMGRGDSAALEYVGHTIRWSVPFAFALAVFGAEIAPWFISVVFPQYRIDPLVPRVVLYGLSVMPIIATVGNLLVGRKKNGLYLLILLVAFAGAFGAEAVLRPRLGMQAAALAQVFGTFALALMLMMVGHAFIRSSAALKLWAWWRPVGWLSVLWAVYFIVRYFVTDGTL